MPAATLMGRPPKLEPWRVERFMQALSTLAPLKTCCAYAGISPRALQRWREYGRRDREQRGGDEDAPVSVYEQFLERYEKTECETELRMLARIQLAGEKEWTAMAWLLERRRPEES